MNEGQAAMANLMLFSSDVVVLSHTTKVQHHLTFSTNKLIKHSFENFKSQCFATVSQKMVPGITSLSQNTYQPLQWEMGDKRGKSDSKSCTLHFQRGMVPPAFLSLSYIILLSMQREDEITIIQSSEKFLHSYISKTHCAKTNILPSLKLQLEETFRFLWKFYHTPEQKHQEANLVAELSSALRNYHRFWSNCKGLS